MFYLVDSTIQHLNNLGKNRLKTTSNLETHFDFFVIIFFSFRLELNMELPAGQQQPIGTASAASAEQVLNYVNIDTLRRSLISKSGNNPSLVDPHHWVHVQ